MIGLCYKLDVYLVDTFLNLEAAKWTWRETLQNGFQVRRTVGALVAVAQGKVSIRDIKFMLEIPSHRSWCPQIKTLPASGLYLCEVEYTAEDLATFRNFLEA